jgi:hypothetical protein
LMYFTKGDLTLSVLMKSERTLMYFTKGDLTSSVLMKSERHP